MDIQAHPAAGEGLQRKTDGKVFGRLEDATASGRESGIDVGEQEKQAGKRAKHRVEDWKDRLKFSDISASNSHQEIMKTSWCPPIPLHVPTHLTTVTFSE